MTDYYRTIPYQSVLFKNNSTRHLKCVQNKLLSGSLLQMGSEKLISFAYNLPNLLSKMYTEMQ